MDGYRRQNHCYAASDRSSMEERKEFFRELGLLRHEVYDFAMRSFQAPAFDLDYFEYRRHNLRQRNLSPFEIKKQLLSEIMDVFSGATPNVPRFNSNDVNAFQMQSMNFGSSFYGQPGCSSGNANFQFSNFGYGNNYRNDNRNWQQPNWQNQSRQQNTYPWCQPPNVEQQARRIVATTLQLMGNDFRPQPLHKLEGNPFEAQRIKAFSEQFRDFDGYGLLTKLIPNHDFQNVDTAVRKLLAKQTPKNTNIQSPAAKRQKTDEGTVDKDADEKIADEKITDEKDADKEDTDEKKAAEKVDDKKDADEKEADEKVDDKEDFDESVDEEDEFEDIERNGEHDYIPVPRKLTPKQERLLNRRKAQICARNYESERPAEEFIKAEKYGDTADLLFVSKMSKPEYIQWNKKVKWIKKHLTITDSHPAIQKTFFCRIDLPKHKNNKKLEGVFQDIQNALKVADENEQYKHSYAYLKGKAIYSEFLYAFKKLYLSHDGHRTLQKIYDLILNVDDLTHYKGIIKMWIEAHENKDDKAEYRTLLNDKSFNWLVHLALQEMKLMHTSVNFSQRLMTLWRFVKFTYEKDVAKAKLLYEKYEYAAKDIHSLKLLLKKQPEINWANCRNFMNQELRVVNDDYNRLISTEAVEERKIVLEELKTNPYVEKVHIYVANKMLAIYERLSYLESVHPRMISRQDLKQLIYFRKFLSLTNLKMFTKYIIEKWRKDVHEFTDPKYRELFSLNLLRYAPREGDDKCKDGKDEDDDANDATSNDNNTTHDVEMKSMNNEKLQSSADETNDLNSDCTENEPKTIDLVSDDDDDMKK